MRRPTAVLLSLALTATAAGAQARTQVDVTVPGRPDAVAVRVLTVFADAQYPIERTEPLRVAAEVPLVQRDMGGRAGTRAIVQAVLLPVRGDSTRVVLTGQILAPYDEAVPAQTIPVTNGEHNTYGKTNRQGWAAIERVASAIR